MGMLELAVDRQTIETHERQGDIVSNLLSTLLDARCMANVLEGFDIDVKPIAEGSSATIHSVHDRQNKKCKLGSPDEVDGVVFKIFTPTANSSVTDQYDSLYKELSAFISVPQHPNILRYFNTFWLHDDVIREHSLQSRWALQVEYCSCGDIHAATMKSPFLEERAQSVMHDVLKALAHLNSHNFVHRDVKPENIFTQCSGTCKIADFGLCASMLEEHEMKKRCGTPGYVAPEVWLGRCYGPQVDTFSLGAVLYFMMSGRMLFYGSGLPSIMRRTVHDEIDFSRTKSLKSSTQACKDFLKSVLTKDPDLRPLPKLALRSSWITQRQFDSSNIAEEAPRTWSCTSPCSTYYSSDLGRLSLSLDRSFCGSFGQIDNDVNMMQSPRMSPRVPISRSKSFGSATGHTQMHTRSCSSLSRKFRSYAASDHPLMGEETEKETSETVVPGTVDRVQSNTTSSSPLSRRFWSNPVVASETTSTTENSEKDLLEPSMAEALSFVESSSPSHSQRRIRFGRLRSKSSHLTKLREVGAKDVTEDFDNLTLLNSYFDVQPPIEPLLAPRKFEKFRNFNFVKIDP